MDHWPLHARAWALLGPPLRPSLEDIAITQAVVSGVACVRALVLGVTPELVTMTWPAGSQLLAVDRDADMVAVVFPAGPDRRAVVGDWLALPVEAGSIEVVVGDGCLTMSPYPAGYAAFGAELARVLAPGGVAIVRVFVAPAQAESLADIAAAVAARAVGTFDALKWRLAAAVAGVDRNLAVTAIRDAFDATFPDRDALAAHTGWSRAVIDRIDVYRDSPARYSFPTLAEARAAFAPFFVERAVHVPRYELGDRCPTFVLAPRGV